MFEKRVTLGAGDRHNDSIPTEPKESFVAFAAKSARDNAGRTSRNTKAASRLRGFTAEQG